MLKKKLTINGLLHGTKIIKKYKNPDILYSKIDTYIYNKNHLTISYNDEKNIFCLYHFFELYNDNEKIYSGRWYNTNICFDSKSIDKKKLTLTIDLKNIDWENFENGIITNRDVKITFFLTKIGLCKIKNMLNYLK